MVSPICASWNQVAGCSVAWMGVGVSPDGGVPPLSLLAAVEDAQHQHGAAIVAVLKCVRSAEHRQDELTVFVAMAEWASQLRMAPEHVSSRNQFAGYACGEIRELVVQERSESIEIGERVERPLDFYWSGHGRKLEVPHVRSHWTTRSCGTRESGVALAARRSSSAISPASASRGVLSNAASSAISWGTVTPSSAARSSSTSAVRRSMSMLTFGPMTPE